MTNIEIPFGAHDSELKSWEYTIPEGFTAEIKDGKVVVREKESEDERMRKMLIDRVRSAEELTDELREWILTYFEKQKENFKSADSIPSDCVSSAKCEDRWHKVADSLPDNGRLVLAQDCLGNTLLARYDGEGNWEVSVYDNDDYYCRNTITKWCEIPSEKQKEQKPVEWGEEDEKKITFLERLIRYNVPEGQYGWVDGHRGGFVTKLEAILMLKSLRPQYHGDVTMTEAYKMGLEAGKASSWKPSDEQMQCLLAVITNQYNAGAESCHLTLGSLYNDLKKLI